MNTPSSDAGIPAVSALGDPARTLQHDEVETFVRQAIGSVDVDGRSVVVIVPDATRSCPLAMLIKTIYGELHPRASRITVLVALGTHQYMSEAALASWVGYPEGELEATYPGMTVINHEWDDPEMLVSVGEIGAERVRELSEGRLDVSVDVRLNRHVVEHDVALVVGPVFPHEVVGFSGGNKYFFPGVAGQDVIDLSHWIGALITSAKIIGTRGITPVRQLINDAADLIPTTKLALCLVVESGSDNLHAISFGTPEDAWAAAADVSAEIHVRYLDRPVKRVVSMMPTKYQDIWTAAKGFYKLEPVVADGGEVIIYAPHVTTISEIHQEINEIGYHCRDYFVKQWDAFKHIHWGVLAHSTHLRGAGTYDEEAGEQLRVTVTLATAIPEEVVRAANLNYADPATLDLEALEADPDTMVIPHAGEILHRLRSAP